MTDSYEKRVVEALSDRLAALEQLPQWLHINGRPVTDENKFTLANAHQFYPVLTELAATNPWHIRGAQLRHSYVFGSGVEFEGIPQSGPHRSMLDDPHNRGVLFSVDAFETNNMSLFTSGNLAVVYNEKTRLFTRVPIMQLTAEITNDDDDTDIWYVRREWTDSKGERQVMWYPTARHVSRVGKGKLDKTQKAGNEIQPVSQDAVVFLKHSKRPETSTWGIPDSLGAVVHTTAYSEYLRDNAMLIKALSRFAWNITQADKKAVQRTASEVHEAPDSVGGAAVSSQGNVSTVGVPSAQVNLNNGQPLIAAVAASFGVPVIALISSPGATGGSYGAATTLDQPTLKGFESLQRSWAEFYHEIFAYVGVKKARAVFSPIEEAPVHRHLTAIALAQEKGMIWQEEARDEAVKAIGISKAKAGIPPLPEDKINSGSDVPKQGNPGAVPGGMQGDSHDLDADG